MHWIAALTRRIFGRTPRHPGHVGGSNRTGRPWHSRASNDARCSARATFAPIASLPAQINPGSTTQVAVNFTAGQITPTRSGAVYIGIDVKAAPGSSASPKIPTVVGPSGLLQYSVDKATAAEYIIKLNPSREADPAHRQARRQEPDARRRHRRRLPRRATSTATARSTRPTSRRIKASYGKHSGQTGYDPTPTSTTTAASAASTWPSPARTSAPRPRSSPNTRPPRPARGPDADPRADPHPRRRPPPPSRFPPWWPRSPSRPCKRLPPWLCRCKPPLSRPRRSRRCPPRRPSRLRPTTISRTRLIPTAASRPPPPFTSSPGRARRWPRRVRCRTTSRPPRQCTTPRPRPRRIRSQCRRSRPCCNQSWSRARAP